MFLKMSWIFIFLLFLTGCIYPTYAMKIKFVSLDGSLKEGTSIGQIKGSDCNISIFNQALGADPSLEQALINASLGVTNPLATMGLMSADITHEPLRYIINMHVERTGFNVYFVGRYCLTVTGIGYK